MLFMKSVSPKRIVAIVLIGTAICLSWIIFSDIKEQVGPSQLHDKSHSAPVEVAQIRHGPIELLRTFSGTLEAAAEFVVAPKVSGRIERVNVDLADTIKRGEIVAELDNDEYIQAVAQAKADLAVAKANLTEAESALEIATRELNRVETLRKRGVASDSQYDESKAAYLAKKAGLEVAQAQLIRAESSLETANIRLRYTKVTAGWTGGNEERIVAERFVDEGETVSANTPLLLIVELDPITGIIFVTEKDYAQLETGQEAELTTDAYPGKRFEGRINRIAPIFRQDTRQARVELNIENKHQRLKPGMFIRATLVLDRVAEATIIPEQALTTRDDQIGVFVVNEHDQTVSWRGVAVGIRDGGLVQVEGEGLTGRVVTLGQQLVDDGSSILISTEQNQKVPIRKETNTE